MKKNRQFFFLFFFLPIISSAQQSRIDSLLKVLETAKEDTNQVNTLLELSKAYRGIADFKPALQYALQSKVLAEKIQLSGDKKKGWPKGIANAINSLGNTASNQGNYKAALDYYFQSLKIRQTIGDKLGIANSYNNIGLVLARQGNVEEALEYDFKSLKMMEELNFKPGIGNSYNNIGLIYTGMEKYDLALNFFLGGLKARKETSDKFAISASYNNLGMAYENLGTQASNKGEANNNYQKALDSHLKSLKIKEEIGDKQGVGSSYCNIGETYLVLGNVTDKKNSSQFYAKALESALKSVQIAEEINDKGLLVNCLLITGDIYLNQNDLEESYKYYARSLAIAKEIGNKNNIKDNYLKLSEVFEKKQDYRQAVEYYKLYNNLKDTLINETSGKRIAEMNVKYDSEKKDKELILKDAEITKKQAESEKQQTQRNAFIIGFGLVLLLALFILRGYRQKKAANELLETKNEAIHKQNIEIENKNTVITDSIEYAKNIQQAILPSEEEIRKHFPEQFILYRPKDIVSGDFYWLHDRGEYVLLAVADCIGHGVPGAFMSLMGYNLLNDVVNTAGNTSLSKILGALNSKVMETLKQDSKNTSAKYGMDIGLMSYNKKTKAIEFAGAHNPLYIFRKKECIQLKADKRSIGSMSTQEFKEQSFQLEKGDMLYLFSDGYVDQLGGKENTKFFAQPFRDLLQEISEMDMTTQKQRLEKAHSDWKRNKKQTDDILIVGIRA